MGVYLAYRYSIPASRWLGSEGMTGQAAGFLLVFGLVLVALALLGRLMRGLFKFAGLGLFDQLGRRARDCESGAAGERTARRLRVDQPHPPLDRRRKTERSWLYRR